MARLCSPQDYLFFSWDVQSYRTFAATCCYRRLNVIERAVTHASLAFFSRRTNTSSVLHALQAYGLYEWSHCIPIKKGLAMVVIKLRSKKTLSWLHYQINILIISRTQHQSFISRYLLAKLQICWVGNVRLSICKILARRVSKRLGSLRSKCFRRVFCPFEAFFAF